MTLTVLREAIYTARTLKQPRCVKTGRKKVKADREWLDDMLAKGGLGAVYGLNTGVGHQDSAALSDECIRTLQKRVIESHCLSQSGSTGHWSDFDARLVGVAKLFALSSGGSGITPALYEGIIKAVCARDFKPRLGVGQSYSCGDVIPAAHWSRQLMQWLGKPLDTLRGGEMMALINGYFFHAGLAAGNFVRTEEMLNIATAASAATAKLSGCPRRNFVRDLPKHMKTARKALSHVQMQCPAGDPMKTAPQSSVSIRAIPETLVALFETAEALGVQVDRALAMPSGNPLIQRDVQGGAVTSQASFLAPGISFAQSALLEAMLFAATAVVGRVNFQLAGYNHRVPRDGVSDIESDVGLIQVPKEMMAQVEKLRLAAGRRLFASGSNTSHGIEDLWTYGEEASALLNEAAETLTGLFIRELAVCELLALRHCGEKPVYYKDSANPKGIMAQQLVTVDKWLRANRTAIRPLPEECLGK